jgi:hypothetical protein
LLKQAEFVARRKWADDQRDKTVVKVYTVLLCSPQKSARQASFELVNISHMTLWIAT